MQVILAGYNVDAEVIGELKKSAPERQDVTPETLSASYARISRDPRPIYELRKAAREEVEKSRKSNQAIIFKMGHHSVAEHAVFNFDVIGVSRLAMEELEKFRLCSYTEKSQRYITLGSDYVLPEEIAGGEFDSEFKALVGLQNKTYQELFEKLKAHVFDKHKDLAADPKNHNLLEGWAKEDARYITPLATGGQLGFTTNARNLELLFRRFASHPSKEIQALGRALYDVAKPIAPSIILFTQANDLDQKTYAELEGKVKGLLGPMKAKKAKEDVVLSHYTKDGDTVLVATLLCRGSNLPYKECLKKAKGMSEGEKKELIKSACQYMEFYDSTIREFEYVNLTYDLVISASCFAQLKRHRIASLIAQSYDPALGITIPPAIIAIGEEKTFRKVVRKSEALYEKISVSNTQVAQYVLTNAHRKRVLASLNARELYHIARLREDQHAQWDIMDISGKMSTKARGVMPLTFMLICGKDSYPKIYQEVFGRLPKITQTA
ncbi:MAG: FAD-dependent thymidylate synthase [Candidatus Saganbacteria bacterium]|nr:FAD-dependent thymidylate synthase [Candidatus Saganbacteria bacterium]